MMLMPAFGPVMRLRDHGAASVVRSTFHSCRAQAIEGSQRRKAITRRIPHAKMWLVEPGSPRFSKLETPGTGRSERICHV
jgi:hypothetical protein